MIGRSEKKGRRTERRNGKLENGSEEEQITARSKRRKRTEALRRKTR